MAQTRRHGSNKKPAHARAVTAAAAADTAAHVSPVFSPQHETSALTSFSSAEDVKKESRKPPTGRWLDVLISLLLFAVALFARLYHISDPAGIVFDEVHFNKERESRGIAP
jgi:hypothetical protein